MEEKSARIMWTRDLALFDGKISEQALNIKAQKHNVCSYWIQRVFLCLVFAGVLRFVRRCLLPAVWPRRGRVFRFLFEGASLS